MTAKEHDQALRLLARCRNGDEYAYERLTKLIADSWGGLIAKLVVTDPALAHEDLEQHFRIGIWQAIDKVKDVGNPIYHIAKRGYWEVLELIEVWYRRHYGCRVWKDRPQLPSQIPDTWEPANIHVELEPEYMLSRKVEQEQAAQSLARIRATALLTNRQHEVWKWMLDNTDELGEFGSGRKLARALGVSEQAASVLTQRTLDKLAAAQ